MKDDAALHRGNHLRSYRDGVDGVLNQMQTRYVKNELTREQTIAEFKLYQNIMRHALDPHLDTLEGPIHPSIKARIALTYNDPRLGTDTTFINEFLPQEGNERCDEATRQKLAASRDGSVSIQELAAAAQIRMLFEERAERIATGQLQAGAQEMPMPDTPGFLDGLRSSFVNMPTINPTGGYVFAGAGAVLLTGGLAAGAITTELTATAITAGTAANSNIIREVATEATKRAAGFILPLVITSDAAQAETDVQKFTVDTLLPSLGSMNAGSDTMGERHRVDHISWRFTGLPAGDSGNSLTALQQRDLDKRLDTLGAHALLRADGSFERSDSLCRDWGSNPQIEAGSNGNAIGLYVEGKGALTTAQRQSLQGLEGNFAGLCQSHQSAPGELSPASHLEQEAWSGPRAVTPGMMMQPAQPAMRAGMGQ